MSTSQTLTWESGVTSAAPRPPLADLHRVEHEEQPMVALYRLHGPVFQVAQPGESEPRIILAGPEANAFMTRHEDEFFTTREHWEQFDAKITQERGSGMATARDGAANRQRRASSSREWSRARILDQIPQMIEITRQYTRDWQPGASIPVHASMRRLVAEQLGRLLLGCSPGDYLDDFVIYLNTTITSTLWKSNNGESLASDDYQRARERVNEFSRKAYEAHLIHPQPNGKPDMIDDAIAQFGNLSEEQRQAILPLVGVAPMLAGIDTVANSLSFALYALTAYPDVRQRVQTEVDSAFRAGSLSWEKLRQMPDLHGMMMETLRRYPVAGGHNARVAQPLTIAGYRLEPGDKVRVAMTVPHFLEELYPHPLEFDIDRYREPRNEHRQRGAYAPFGLGNHTCLGSGIAEVQLMVTTATLLHFYTLQFDPPAYQLVIERHPTPVPGNNFQVKVLAAK